MGHLGRLGALLGRLGGFLPQTGQDWHGGGTVAGLARWRTCRKQLDTFYKGEGKGKDEGGGSQE